MGIELLLCCGKCNRFHGDTDEKTVFTVNQLSLAYSQLVNIFPDTDQAGWRSSENAAVLKTCTPEPSNESERNILLQTLPLPPVHLFMLHELFIYCPLAAVVSSYPCARHTLCSFLCHTVTSWISQQALLSHHHLCDWFQLTVDSGCHVAAKEKKQTSE